MKGHALRVSGFGGRWQRKWWLGAGVLVSAASLLWSGIQLAHGGLGPSDTAGVLGLPLGVLALVMGLRPSAPIDLADQLQIGAKTLAGQVAASEGPQLVLLLGEDAERINLSYAVVPGPREAETDTVVGRMTAVAASSSGGLPVRGIAEFYQAVRPQRLLITGEPGSGKTALALQLILDLVASRQPEEPVPLRVTAAQWDTTVSLDEHLVTVLMDTLPWPAAMVRSLVQQRMVLPVLDGLDEMDPLLPTGLPDPGAPRARAALVALNHYQASGRPAPVVVTCRAAHYQALDTGLVNAAQVSIGPVDSAAAEAYLRARTGEPARWQPLFDDLQNYPTGMLARALSTPWRLCLAATVFAELGDPRDLTTQGSPQALYEFLISRYLPATVALHGSGRYSARQVHRWLHHLASGLAPASNAAAPGGTDIVLHQLWSRRPGRGIVRDLDAILTLIAVMIVPCAALPFDANTGFVILLTVMAPLSILAALYNIFPPRPPRRTRWRNLASREGFGRLRLGMSSGLKAGSATFAATGVLFGWIGYQADKSYYSGSDYGGLPEQNSDLLEFGLGAGAAVGLFCALVALICVAITMTFTGDPTEAAQPRQLIRTDITSGLMTGATVGFIVWILAKVTALQISIDDMPALGLALLCGFTTTLTYGAAASRRYLVFLLYRRNKFPFRLGLFCEWAAEAGLLRLSGPAYQFRHRELQAWLALHPNP